MSAAAEETAEITGGGVRDRIERMRNALVFSLLVLVGCATSKSTNDADPYIRTAADRFVRAFNAGNTEAVTAFYADDAVLLLPNAPIARGTASIRGTVAAVAGQHPTLEFGPDRIAQSGDMAYETGHYAMTMGGNQEQGNYVAVWRRQSNGDWKLVADSVVSTQPPMAH